MQTCKLFISQPMSDKSEEQIKAERERAIARAQEHVNSFPELKGTTIEVIDSFIKDAPEDAKPLWYLGKSLELMADADIVFFIEGWNKYCGCRIENAAAKRNKGGNIFESLKKNKDRFHLSDQLYSILKNTAKAITGGDNA